MSRILLIANLNCDRIIQLEDKLVSGGRIVGKSLGRRLGGAAANTGIALAFAGHQVRVACSVGTDETGDWLLAEAQLWGVNGESVRRYSGQTGEVLILLGKGERTLCFIDPRPPYLPQDKVLDYQPECLFIDSICPEVASLMAASINKRLVIAQVPMRPISYWPAHILLASAADLHDDVLSDPFTAARAIAGNSLNWVVITRGALGADAYSASQHISVPAHPSKPVDTTGAGDVFAAGLMDALLAGRSMQAALAAGARWAAFAVESASSIPPDSLRLFLNHSGR